MKFTLQYKRYSEKAILIEWPSEINKNILKDLLSYKKQIEYKSIESVVEVITGYNSLLICYDITIDDFYEKVEALKLLYASNFLKLDTNTKLWEIPVCYSLDLAPDLKEYAATKSLTIDEVITLHTTLVYTVYCIGFLPGFLYLGGLDENLFLPRKKTPSLKVKKGSVAVGGNQTGIYPEDSPGGWHVIGKCPLGFFNVYTEPPCVFEPGDTIRFTSVDVAEYNDIRSQVYENKYLLKSTSI
ncbi:5-oxoprolinase subunit PxpB [Aquimarina mytili]|uniref:5-oxoprolinase subunit PxpB n=1 Tax=Aquimarina mytili TaxID=874423 RepID=A0A937DAF4_9FLAO|nr:5-oxoprolinase subunit PxpB [Aquimarina mytili]MBL0682646.1 5-oxoprolinase subunit PxpB [Aquimarina mytili]